MSAPYINVPMYHRLSPEVRREFDAWLEAEGLVELCVVELTFGEGHVEGVKHSLNELGRAHLDARGEVATERFTMPVSTPPPLTPADVARVTGVIERGSA